MLTAYTALVWGKRKTFKGGFIPRIGSLSGKAFVRTSSKRLPIKRMYGPAMAKELFRDETEKYIKDQWPVRLVARIDQELKFELGKIKKDFKL